MSDYKREEAERKRLVRQGRANLAQVMQWPDGALEACAELDQQLPGWTVSWLPSNTITGFEREPCFIAWRGSDGFEVRGPNPQTLVDAIEQEPEHDWGVDDCRCRGCRRW